MLANATYHALNRTALALDQLRTATLSLGARSPWLRPYVVHKQTRIVTQSLGHAVVALGATLLCPTLLLVLGPLLLGVPHVASDVRYLVLRRSLPRAFVVLVLVFSAVLVISRLLETAHLEDPRFASVEVMLVTLWLTLSVLASDNAGPRRALLRPAAVLTGCLALGGLALTDASLSRLVFAHAHNVVGLVVWYALFRPRSALALLPLAFVLVASLGLFLVGGSLFERLVWPEWFDLHLETAQLWLAPGLSPDRGRGLVLAYAFLQSVHYAIWLLFIPQDALRRPGSATFCMSLKSAWTDFRPWGLLLIGTSSLLVLAAACFDPLTTSALYLFVTPFHGYLELAVLAGWLASGRSASPPQSDPEASHTITATGGPSTR